MLFLDEAPEFATTVLDCLRQPLEAGETVVHRSRAVARFPARFQLVAAANPCPCGQWGFGECRCSDGQLARYRRRLSGPIKDRVDLWVPVEPPSGKALFQEPAGETERVLARIRAARERQAQRYGPGGLNATAAVELHQLAAQPAVRRLVERQNGWVSLRPREGGGTVAEVRLPRA